MRRPVLHRLHRCLLPSSTRVYKWYFISPTAPECGLPAIRDRGVCVDMCVYTGQHNIDKSAICLEIIYRMIFTMWPRACQTRKRVSRRHSSVFVMLHHRHHTRHSPQCRITRSIKSAAVTRHTHVRCMPWPLFHNCRDRPGGLIIIKQIYRKQQQQKKR